MSAGTNGPLTVLHVFSGDLWAGAEVVIFHLLNSLKDDAHINILALSLNEGILTNKLREARIETYVIPESKNSFANIFLKAINLLKKKRLDIIHSHRYKENLLALLLAKSMKVKRLVATLHGLSEPPANGQNGANSIELKTKLDYFILSRYFSRVIAVSREMKKSLIENYGFNKDKVDFINNGIELPSGIPVYPAPRKYFQIGSVGRMVPVKDFNLFLEVAAELKRRTDRVQFSILGDGPLKNQLVRKAKDLKIEDCVTFLPPRPDPFSYHQSLDLFLNTSTHEGIPLSLLEAMACGRTVVAPRVGGIPEIISDGEDGLLVDGREPERFAEVCLRVMKDENLRQTMADNASKKVTTYFSSSQMARSYCQLYMQ